MKRETRLADIAHLGFPSNAPLTIRLSRANEALFQRERRLSFPGGRSKEHGGTIVADASGRLSVQNLGGLTSDSGSFSYNLIVRDGARFTVVGTFHTHPYDRTEGSYTGVSFSGPDIANFINRRLVISVVQSGPRLFALVSTARTPVSVDRATIAAAQESAMRERMGEGRTFQQASRVAAESIAPIFGLAYYQGIHGMLTRVSPR